MENNRQETIIDALVHHGFERGSAYALLAHHDRDVLEESDHSAYRELADKVNELIQKISDPDDWDGDDSELHILITFLGWLPDMIRHQEAEKIRALKDKQPPHWAGVRIEVAAGEIDPFEKIVNGNGEWLWRRKSDGTPVPWNSVRPNEE